MKFKQHSSIFRAFLEKMVILNEDLNDGTYVYSELSDKSLAFGNGNGYKNGIVQGVDLTGNIVLPETYESKKITVIKTHAFFNILSMTGVVIPRYITSIEYASFWENTNVQFLSFAPNSELKKIETDTFGHMYSVKSLILPKSLTSMSMRSFHKFSNLTTLYYCGSADFSSSNFIDAATSLEKVFVSRSYRYSTFSKMPAKRVLDCPSDTRRFMCFCTVVAAGKHKIYNSMMIFILITLT